MAAEGKNRALRREGGSETRPYGIRVNWFDTLKIRE
jgi:hypothetical protein